MNRDIHRSFNIDRQNSNVMNICKKKNVVPNKTSKKQGVFLHEYIKTSFKKISVKSFKC